MNIIKCDKTYTKLSEYMQPKTITTTITTTITIVTIATITIRTRPHTHTPRTPPPYGSLPPTPTPWSTRHRRLLHPADLLAFTGVLKGSYPFMLLVLINRFYITIKIKYCTSSVLHAIIKTVPKGTRLFYNYIWR